MITIKPYYQGVEKELFEVFSSAVTQVCIKDYSEEQINAWVPEEYDHEMWKMRIDAIKPFIAAIDGVIVGYADIQNDGYIDHFFVGGDYQSQGVARALMNKLLLQSIVADKAYSNVSITARPFFEKNGFKVVKKNIVQIRCVDLVNFSMERSL